MDAQELFDAIEKVNTARQELVDLTDPLILNENHFNLDFLGKVVLQGDDAIYRVGDYNNMDTQMYFANYANEQGYEVFLPQTLIKDYNWVRITKQPLLDEVSPITMTDDEAIEKIQEDWGDDTINFLNEQGIFGLGHSNTGILNDKIRIVDWMGGPVRCGNLLVGSNGETLMEIEEVTE